MQIILLLTVIMASMALLFASHRAGHRLFLRVSVLIGLIAVIFLAALLFQPGRGVESMPVDQLRVELISVNATETGYRIDGNLVNLSAQALAGTDLVASRDCKAAPRPCNSYARTTMTVLLHVPSGANYPFSTVVDIPPVAGQEFDWHLEITAARAFR